MVARNRNVLKLLPLHRTAGNVQPGGSIWPMCSWKRVPKGVQKDRRSKVTSSRITPITCSARSIRKRRQSPGLNGMIILLSGSRALSERQKEAGSLATGLNGYALTAIPRDVVGQLCGPHGSARVESYDTARIAFDPTEPVDDLRGKGSGQAGFGCGPSQAQSLGKINFRSFASMLFFPHRSREPLAPY